MRKRNVRMKMRKSRKALEKENAGLRRDVKAYREAWARVIDEREDAIRAAALKDITIKNLHESLDRKNDEIDAVEADLRAMRAQRDALMEELRKVKLTLGAANYASDVLEQRCKALEAAKEGELAREYYNAFGVIAGIANKMMQNYLKGEGVCSDC